MFNEGRGVKLLYFYTECWGSPSTGGAMGKKSMISEGLESMRFNSEQTLKALGLAAG